MEPFVRLRSLLTDRCFTVVKLTGFERLNLFQVTAYFFLCYISSLTVIKGIVYCLIVGFSCYSFIVLLVFSCIPSVYAFVFFIIIYQFIVIPFSHSCFSHLRLCASCSLSVSLLSPIAAFSFNRFICIRGLCLHLHLFIYSFS